MSRLHAVVWGLLSSVFATMPAMAELASKTSSPPSSSSSSSSSSPQPPPASTDVIYRVDGARSEIAIEVFRAPSLASALGHDHVMRPTTMSGTIRYDAQDEAATEVAIEAQTASIVVDEPSLRARYGMKSQVSADDALTVTKAVRSEEHLDVTRFPTMSFRSTRATRGDDGRLLLTGALTLHGVKRTISLPVTVTKKSDGEIVGEGSFKAKQTDFGVEPCNKMLGALKCADEVTIHVRLTGTR